MVRLWAHCCTGGPGSQRLAARFIPKFAACFPAKLSKAIQSLIHLINAQEATAEGVVLLPVNLTTCGDALEGLGAAGAAFCRTASVAPSALQHVMETLLK